MSSEQELNREGNRKNTGFDRELNQGPPERDMLGAIPLSYQTL